MNFLAQLSPRTLATLPWALFSLVWVVTAVSAKKAIRRESWIPGMTHRVPLIIACILIFAQNGLAPGLARPVLPPAMATQLGGVAVALLGIGFAIWARVHLGTMWSSTVTLKSEHKLIQSGPYALVRHPIYTGVLVALVGTAVTIGTLQAFLSLPMFAFSLILKLSQEEQLMAATFGTEHAAYRRRVKRLIPFVW